MGFVHSEEEGGMGKGTGYYEVNGMEERTEWKRTGRACIGNALNVYGM